MVKVTGDHWLFKRLFFLFFFFLFICQSTRNQVPETCGRRVKATQPTLSFMSLNQGLLSNKPETMVFLPSDHLYLPGFIFKSCYSSDYSIFPMNSKLSYLCNIRQMTELWTNHLALPQTVCHVLCKWPDRKSNFLIIYVTQ